MQRKIFCPSDRLLDEASVLSKETGLLIQVGDSIKTKDLNIDRDIVSIIRIPEEVSLDYKSKVKLGFHQVIYYINDFQDSKQIKLFIGDSIIHPMYTETYRNKYLFYPSRTGIFSCKIFNGEELIEEFEFSVY